MRCYFFTNFMYSSIQQGIQPLHAVVEMYCKYTYASCHRINMLEEWAYKHKTVICLNGGCNADMKSILEHLDSADNPYPYAPFNEDETAMGAEVLTSIGIVLSERIYQAAEWLRQRKVKFCEELSGDEGSGFECALMVEDKCRQFMSAAEIVRMEEAIEAFGRYTAWEIRFINDHLNQCGLAR